MNNNNINEYNKIWDKALEITKNIVHDKETYNVILKDSFIHTIKGDTLIISCISQFSAQVITNNYKDFLTKTINNLTQTNFKLVFSDNNSLKINKDIDTIINTSKPIFFENCKLNENFKFSNFVTGESNLQAYQCSVMISNNPGLNYNPLFIYGQSGLGKTHLLNAIGNQIREKFPELKILCCSSHAFFDEFQLSVRENNNADKLKEYIKSFDVLLIDDVQFFQNKKSTEEFFFGIFEYMYSKNKQIVLTSDKSPKDLRNLDERLVTRFGMGIEFAITKPDKELMKNILKMKINNLNLSHLFSEDVINYLSENAKCSIRELEGMLNRITYSTIIHPQNEYTVDFVKTALNLNKTNSNKIDEDIIINTVAEYYNVSSSQILGKNKSSNIANARHVAIYLIRTIMKTPYKQIGLLFSNRDHSTIMYSVKIVEKSLIENTGFGPVITEIKKKLKN